jgi:hypothetical protein
VGFFAKTTIELMLTGADEYRFLWKDVLLIKDPR